MGEGSIPRHLPLIYEASQPCTTNCALREGCHSPLSFRMPKWISRAETVHCWGSAQHADPAGTRIGLFPLISRFCGGPHDDIGVGWQEMGRMVGAPANAIYLGHLDPLKPTSIMLWNATEQIL